MDKKKRNGTKGKFFLVYTAIFILMLWVVFQYFWENDRTFVWMTDGSRQHYRALLYYSKWLREFFSRVLIQHDFHLPAYSFSMGYGADVLTTLHYYVIGDPLTFFSVLVPESAMLSYYEFLILLRIYLSGITFSSYCFYRKKTSGYALLAGTFVYIFCGYALYAGVRHPFFLNPMVYLPLLLLGVEKLWREKKPAWFVGSVCISALSNFYFFYMIVLLTVLYVMFRLLSVYRLAQWKKIIGKVLELFGYALIGVSLGAVILLPVIMMFLENSRLGVGYQFDFWYSDQYYEAFLPSLLLVVSPGKWSHLGYAAVSIPTIFMLILENISNFVRWCKRTRAAKGKSGEEGKEEVLAQEADSKKADAPFAMGVSQGALGAGFLMLTLFFLFPAAGYALNGFAYVANRWGWAYSMLVAFIVVTMWDGLLHAKPKRIFCVAWLSISFGILCIFIHKSTGKTWETNLRFSIILLVCCVVCLGVTCIGTIRLKTSRCKMFWPQMVLLILTLVHIGGMAYCQYSKECANYIAEFRQRKNFQKNYAVSEVGAVAAVAKKGEDTGFVRYTGRGLSPNATLGSGLSSTQFYWSLANSVVGDYFTEQELAESSGYNYRALDDRAALCAFAGIKYYITKGDGTAYVPYGYERVELPDKYKKKYTLYQNNFALGLGYSYKNYILKEDYEALDARSKQEAMLLGLVLSKDVEGFCAARPVSTAQEVDFTMDFVGGEIAKDGKTFHAKKKGAKLDLTLEGLPECETYLVLTGLSYDWEKGKNATQTMEFSISAVDEAGETVEKTLKYMGASSAFYNGRHDYSINLCYGEKKKVSVSVIFPQKGVYHIDQVKVICQPLKLYEEAVVELRREGLVDVDLHDGNPVAATDRVTGQATLSEPRLLALAIPYSKGWEAFVDGTRQELLQANTMYCALALEAGSHRIELRYHTPGLATGFMISLLGLAVWVGMLVLKKRRR